jgi:hypothetical protein
MQPCLAGQAGLNSLFTFCFKTESKSPSGLAPLKLREGDARGQRQLKV